MNELIAYIDSKIGECSRKEDVATFDDGVKAASRWKSSWYLEVEQKSETSFFTVFLFDDSNPSALGRLIEVPNPFTPTPELDAFLAPMMGAAE